jgi:flagellum-specific ATP synthase
MPDVVSADHRAMALRFRELLATYTENEDLVNLGAYTRGASAPMDEALDRIEGIRGFLKQEVEDNASLESSVAKMAEAIGWQAPGAATA